MLENIKVLLGITDSSKDQLLTILIDHAINEAKNYTHNEQLGGCDNIISAMVIWRYNRLGSEALSSENYSGVSFSYENDYPAILLRQLNCFKKVLTL